MRVLGITNVFPRPGHETYGTFNRQQFGALARRHAVLVIVPVPWPQVLWDRLRGRMLPNRTRSLDAMDVEYSSYFYPPRVMPPSYGHWYYRSIRRRALRAIEEFKPDVLYSCWAHPDGWATVKLARECGLPCAIEVIGTDVLVLARNAGRRKRIVEALSAADCVLAVSQDLASHVVGLGIPRERVHVVLRGVDRERFKPGNQERARAELRLPATGRILLFVGNLLYSKGAGAFIEACRLLDRRGVAFHAYLIGRGRDAASLRQAAERDGLDSKLVFAGPQPHESLPKWFQACDVVSLPSFSEGIPNVLNEALSCGKPFVATRVGGIPEIAHPSYSRLVEPGDAAELANALAAMLASPPSVDLKLVWQRTVSWEESEGMLSARLAEIVAAGNGPKSRDCSSVAHSPAIPPLAGKQS